LINVNDGTDIINRLVEYQRNSELTLTREPHPTESGPVIFHMTM